MPQGAEDRAGRAGRGRPQGPTRCCAPRACAPPGPPPPPARGGPCPPHTRAAPRGGPPAENPPRAGTPAVIPAPSVADGLESATAWAQDNQGTAVVCGSLFLVGEVLALEEGAGAIDPSEGPRAP